MTHITRLQWSHQPPVLTILTCHMLSRPHALTVNLASVSKQRLPIEQYIIEDPEPNGSGYEWVADALKAAAPLATGHYIMTLDDDDFMPSSNNLPAILGEMEHAKADVAVCKFGIGMEDGGHLVIPEDDYWEKPPVHGHVTGGGMVARTNVYQEHADQMVDIGKGIYSADFSLIKSYFDAGRHVIWVYRMLGEAQFRGLGRPEPTYYAGPIMVE